MKPVQLDRGLWRWSAPHPDWRPGTAGSSADWPRYVGCTLFATSTIALFVDPMLPSATSAFWRWSDERCAGRSVAVFTTIGYHARSRDAFIARYGGARYGEGAADELTLPGGVHCLPLDGVGETLVWLAEARTLITGDSIIGAGRGRLRLCPESWLEDAPGTVTLADLREQLGDLLAPLPIERVLVSHGEPVLSGGREALAMALGVVALSRHD